MSFWFNSLRKQSLFKSLFVAIRRLETEPELKLYQFLRHTVLVSLCSAVACTTQLDTLPKSKSTSCRLLKPLCQIWSQQQTCLSSWQKKLKKNTHKKNNQEITFGDPLHKILCTVLKHSLHIFRSHRDFLRLDQHKTFSGCLCKTDENGYIIKKKQDLKIIHVHTQEIL